MLIDSSFKFVEIEKLNPLCSLYKIYICKPAKANGFTFTKEVLSNENMMITIPSSPIVAGFMAPEGKRLGGHTNDLVKLNGSLKRTPQVQAIGYIREQEPFWETYKDEEWLTCYGVIWTSYFSGLGNLDERIASGDIHQSMEIQMDYDKDKVVTNCYLEGLCVLEGVNPAFVGSTIVPVKFSKSDYIEQVKSLKQELESLNKYSTIDFSIPKEIKTFSSITIKSNNKLTSVCKSNLNYLLNNDHISPDKILYMQKYFSNIQDRKTFSLNGDDVLLSWGEKLISSMKEIDKNGDGKAQNNFSNKDTNNDIKKEGENMSKFTTIQKEEFATKFSLTVNQIKDLINEACSEFTYTIEERTCKKYWIFDFDDTYAYGYDEENGGYIALPFSISEEGKIVIDSENVKKAKQLNLWVIEDNDDFANTEDDSTFVDAMKSKCSEAEEMCNTRLSEMEVKLTETESKLGQQFAATTSLETALEDEKKISEERQKQVDELSAQLKAKDETEKMSKSKELMSKNEFKVFSSQEISEILEASKEKTYEDFETFAYAKLGKFAGNNFDYSQQDGKFSYMYVPSVSPDNKNLDEKDDVYAEIRKKKNNATD